MDARIRLVFKCGDSEVELFTSSPFRPKPGEVFVVFRQDEPPLCQIVELVCWSFDLRVDREDVPLTLLVTCRPPTTAEQASLDRSLASGRRG